MSCHERAQVMSRQRWATARKTCNVAACPHNSMHAEGLGGQEPAAQASSMQAAPRRPGRIAMHAHRRPLQGTARACMEQAGRDTTVKSTCSQPQRKLHYNSQFWYRLVQQRSCCALARSGCVHRGAEPAMLPFLHPKQLPGLTCGSCR